MIFTPAEARKIKRGKQTMTLRHVTRHKRADGSYTRPAPCSEGDLIPCALRGHKDPMCRIGCTCSRCLAEAVFSALAGEDA